MTKDKQKSRKKRSKERQPPTAYVTENVFRQTVPLQQVQLTAHHRLMLPCVVRSCRKQLSSCNIFQHQPRAGRESNFGSGMWAKVIYVTSGPASFKTDLTFLPTVPICQLSIDTQGDLRSHQVCGSHMWKLAGPQSSWTPE